MQSRAELALQKRQKGYNCAQAVACAYCDLVNLDEETAFRVSEAFGSGMGGLNATCGAVSAAVMLTGAKNSTVNLEAPNSKSGSYKLSAKIIDLFLAENKTLICETLKGINTSTPPVPCQKCITDACEFIEQVLFSD